MGDAVTQRPVERLDAWSGLVHEHHGPIVFRQPRRRALLVRPRETAALANPKRFRAFTPPGRGRRWYLLASHSQPVSLTNWLAPLSTNAIRALLFEPIGTRLTVADCYP